MTLCHLLNFADKINHILSLLFLKTIAFYRYAALGPVQFAPVLLLLLQPGGNCVSLYITRICTSLGLRMKFKILFMSDHDLLIFFNMSNQFLPLGV